MLDLSNVPLKPVCVAQHRQPCTSASFISVDVVDLVINNNDNNNKQEVVFKQTNIA